MLKKFSGIALALCAVFVFSHPARALPLSPADRAENALVFQHALHASLRAARGEHIAAARMFDEIARHTGDPALARAAVEAAQAGGNFPLAAQYAQTWETLGGGAYAKIHRATAVALSGNLRAAEPMLNELVRRGELPPATLFRILSAVKDRPAAFNIAKRVFAADSLSQYHFGRLAARFNEMDDARAAFFRAVRGAQIPEPFFALALMAETEQDAAAAVLALDDYRAKGCPGASVERCHESYALLAYRQFSAADSSWRDSLNAKHRPHELQARARVEAGAMLELAGLLKRAALQYAETPPGKYYFQARLGMARIARDGGDIQLALDILDETPAGGKNFILRETTAADLLSRMRGPEAAMRRIAKAREAAPANSDMLYRHSLYAERAGRIDFAVALLEKMTALFPDDPDGWNALGYVMANHGMNLPEARAHIARALQMRPNDPNFLDSLGWVHYRLGNLALARQHLEAAARKSDSAEIAAHLGEVLWELGEHDAARVVWRGAIRSDGENHVLRETLARYHPF